jgi:methylenetetrahydrofolate dehydrogenase (NADP+)/methenyltetrahydrofolate cyclohydrolase
MLELRAKPLKEIMTLDLKSRIQSLTKSLNRKPKLSVVIVGENPASTLYVAQKEKVALDLGMESETIRFDASVKPQTVQERIQSLNQNQNVDGVLIQRPLPPQFNEQDVLYWVDPSKDVDAFHPETVGQMVLGLPGFKPCTPWGVIKLLDHYGLSVSGKTVCVIGRSAIVGKPLAMLLTQRDATVIHAHSKTKNLKELTLLCDFVFVAVGKPKMIDASYIRPGAVVIDVGISKLPTGETVGDVDFPSTATQAHAVTPVPGGVGPMTIMILMENTVISAESKIKAKVKSHA